MFGKPYEVEVSVGQGAHGGGDTLLQEQIFSYDPPKDPWGRSASQEQGAASVLIGIAANTSFMTGELVRIADLCPELGTTSRLSDLT